MGFRGFGLRAFGILGRLLGFGLVGAFRRLGMQGCEEFWLSGLEVEAFMIYGSKTVLAFGFRNFEV